MVPANNCEAYRSEVSKYNWDVRTMMAIMEAESTTYKGGVKVSCDRSAVGDDYVIQGIYAPSCGLFQVRTLKGRPGCGQLQDPATNILWAYKIYTGQGLSAWSVYTNGKYLQYLK